MIDNLREDIWRYFNFLEKVAPENRLSSERNNFTPVEKMGDWSAKREDKSAVGSHKFRALEFQISRLVDAGIERAVLSSSGNAAIAASRILPAESKLKLFIFLSEKTPVAKLTALDFSKNCVFVLSDRPLRMAKYAAKHFKISDLRPSVDPNAVVGFRSLGFEIFEQNPRVANIFSFATSGASARGIAEAFEILVKSGDRKSAPKIFAVGSSGKLAGNLSGPASKNLSEKIERVEISDAEILATRRKFPKLATSAEGLASLAAAEKLNPAGESLVILTGRNWAKNGEVDFSQFARANNFAEVDKIFAEND